MTRLRSSWLCAILSCGALVSGCHKRSAGQSDDRRPVVIRSVISAAGDIRVWLPGRVNTRGPTGLNQEEIGQAADYTITVNIPEGAEANLSRGQSVRVMLPIVHDQETHANVEAIDGNEVRLRLSRQVQELNGQLVRMEIALKPRGLFRIPFNAIYSPRGNPTQAFVVTDGRAMVRDLKLVTLASPTELWVTGPLNPQDQVVIRGLDNLISGDAVKVVPGEKELP